MGRAAHQILEYIYLHTCLLQLYTLWPPINNHINNNVVHTARNQCRGQGTASYFVDLCDFEPQIVGPHVEYVVINLLT